MSASQVPQPTVGELMKLRFDLEHAWIYASGRDESSALRRAYEFIESLPLGTKIKTFHYKRRDGK